MSAHAQTGRTQRMIAAAARFARDNSKVQVVVLFPDQSKAAVQEARHKRYVPSNLNFMGITRTVIGRINWGHQTVTIEGRDWPCFFDHEVVDNMLAQLKSLEGQWNSGPGDYGYKEPTDGSN
jgi:hypothetical protein